MITFIDINIKFKKNPNFKYEIKEGDVKSSDRYIRFISFPFRFKQEIKLNDYLKPELRKAVILINKKSELDDSNINLFKLSYSNFKLRKISGDGAISIPLKKVPKKNCNSDFNKFSIKIISNYFGSDIVIGLMHDINSDFSIGHCVGLSENEWGYIHSCGVWSQGDTFNFLNKYKDGVRVACKCNIFEKTEYTNDDKKFREMNECKEGDVVSCKYDSVKGNIEVFKNGTSIGLMARNIDTSLNYLFAVSLIQKGDCIKMVDNPY